MADSLDMGKLFRQSRYEDAEAGAGDYLNAPFSREEYDAFIAELVEAKRVIMRDFESKDLFQACQPIEEVARTGHDAPRFGTLKPVGLIGSAHGDGARGLRCSCAPRTPRAKATTSSASRPTSRSPSSAASSA